MLWTDLKYFAPEGVMATTLIVLFIVDALLPSARKSFLPLWITLVGCLLGCWATYGISLSPPALVFSGFFTHDGMSAFFRYFFFVLCALGAYLAFGSQRIEGKTRLEFCLLLWCVTFGMSLMANAAHFLTLYLGVETVSIVSFVLAGFCRSDPKGNEAALKYLVFGGLTLGLMAYGVSLLYGLTGSLSYRGVATFILQNPETNGWALVFSVLLIYAGIAFKISAFPVHFWTPDVYEGAPTPVTAFFSVAPKAAGFAALTRLLIEAFSVKTGDGLWQSLPGLPLTEVIALFSALTMIVGNFCALGQKSVKRMLAYSSIAHAGYLMMGFVAVNPFGLSAILFYLVAYCAMNLGAFWVVSGLEERGTEVSVDTFKALGKNQPLVAICMSVFLLSLTGLPLFAGFSGKFLLFANVIKTPGFLWLGILGVLNSVISLYYYARVLGAMWLVTEGAEQGLESSEHQLSSKVPELPLYDRIALVGLALPTVLLGVFFSPLLNFAEATLANLL